jgi:hypothetical protein
MSIIFSYTLSVDQIQKKLKDYYPYLKVEFYAKTFVGIDGCLCNSRLHKSTNLKNLISDRPIEVPVTGTALQMESVFHLHFDVIVKIFRKTGNGWLDISLDGKNSLFYHNRRGRDASNAIFDFELL